MSQPTKDEIDSFWCRLHLFASVAKESMPLDELNVMSRAVDRADTLYPYLDPTGWMNNREALDEKKELLRATMDYVAIVNRIADSEINRRKCGAR